MDVVYRKTGFKREFSRFLMYKYKISCEKKTINTYLKLEIRVVCRDFFLSKKQMLEYTFKIESHFKNWTYNL